MIDTPADPELVEAGAWGTVRYARRSSGAMESRDWLLNAEARIQAKFSVLFRKIASTGKISNSEQFRHLRDGIWEFKRNGHRILCFQEQRCWRLTHHYAKRSQKCPKREIERAIQIRAEHEQQRG